MSKVVLPDASWLQRFGVWCAEDEVLCPVLGVLTGIGSFFGVVLLLGLWTWWSVALAVAVLTFELWLTWATTRACAAAQDWPESVMLTVRGGRGGTEWLSAYPPRSLGRWKELEEPARTLARPLVDGLAAACAQYDVDPSSEAAQRAIVERCTRLDALHAEQLRMAKEARLAGFAPLDNADLQVGDALLEAFDQLRRAQKELEAA